MAIDWFSVKHGTPSDAKLTMIAKKIGVRRCEMTAVWFELMDYASRCVTRGHVTGCDLELISFNQEINIEIVQKIYAALIEKSVINNEQLTNWEKNQPSGYDPTATKRKREQRERERLIKLGINPDDEADGLTASHVPSRDSHTDQTRIRLGKKEGFKEGNKLPTKLKIIKNLNLPTLPREKKNGEGVLNNFNSGRFDVRHHISEQTLEKVKKVYGEKLGHDVQALMNIYNNWHQGRSAPDDWNAALFGWFKNFTKDKPAT